jgi:hypothetical protein
VICKKTDGSGDHHIKRNKPVSQRQVSHAFSHVEFRGNKIGHESKMWTLRYVERKGRRR